MPDDMTHRMAQISRAINDVLVAAHGPRHDLAAKGDMPPFWTNQGDLSARENENTSIATALAHYGAESPDFRTWVALRAIDALAVAWTGKRP